MSEETNNNINNDFEKLTIGQLYSKINELENNKNRNIEENSYLSKIKDRFNLIKEENQKTFSTIKSQIDENKETLDFSGINRELYDINYVESNLKQTIYEYAILNGNETVYNQLLDEFENISFNSIGFRGLMIIELISFMGFTEETINKTFEKTDSNFIAYYRNKIIHLQSLLKKDNINTQDLFNFYRVLSERIKNKIFNSIIINAYTQFIKSDDLDDLEELVQDYRTEQYLNRIYKMMKPKRTDNDYSTILLYLSIIFYELKKTIEIVKKEDEDEKREEEEAKKMIKEDKMSRISEID